MLEQRVSEWRAYVRRRQTAHPIELEKLEDELCDQVKNLAEAGLAEDEAFLVAVKRLGELDPATRDYSARLWKQLSGASSGFPESSRQEAMVALGLAVAAAVAIKLPELFDLSLKGADAAIGFYARNFSLFVLPLLAGYFAWKRSLDRAGRLWLALPFLAAAVAVNLMPFERQGHTEVLTALHLPIALWLAVGFAHTGGRWRDPERRMSFVRFSGEWFVTYALIGLGGGVLMLFTAFIFHAIGFDVEWFLSLWLLPCGVVGAVLVSAWVVEGKQSVIESLAPMLTRLFTPLFTPLLLVFLVTMIWTGSGIDVDREVLIGFDLLLVLVLGLLLYSISARDPQAPPGAFDALQLLLVICAILVDAAALWAIAARISEFGLSPNKVTALGENLVLLVNLGWSAVLYARFLARRASFTPLERWQTAYLPVYMVWAWVVVVVVPPLFNYQ